MVAATTDSAHIVGGQTWTIRQVSASENWISNKHEFFERIVAPIPGWLHRGAAIRTMDMLEYQEQCGVQGSLLEIGVYCGKYLSILIRHAGRSKTPVLGIDTFQLASLEKVIEHLGPVTSVTGTSAGLMKVFSTDCDAITVLGQLSQRVRFVSIDGSHERDDVHWDLELAEQVAAPGGIVAVDDFLNPLTFGVNEGTHIFFSRPRRLVPWAYIENKLFLTDRQWAWKYREMLEQKVMQDEVEPHSRRFREASKESRGLVEQRLWGATVLLLP
jgi:hypothetical protein